MEEVTANKVLLACNLTFWEVSQQTYVQALLASLGVVIGQNLEPPSVEGGSIRNWVLSKGEIHPFRSGGRGEVSDN